MIYCNYIYTRFFEVFQTYFWIRVFFGGAGAAFMIHRFNQSPEPAVNGVYTT